VIRRAQPVPPVLTAPRVLRIPSPTVTRRETSRVGKGPRVPAPGVIGWFGWLLVLLVLLGSTAATTAHAAGPLGTAAFLPRDVPREGAERDLRRLRRAPPKPVPDALALGRSGAGRWGVAFTGGGTGADPALDEGEALATDEPAFDDAALDELTSPAPAGLPPADAAGLDPYGLDPFGMPPATTWSQAFGPTVLHRASLPAPAPQLGAPPLHFGTAVLALAPASEGSAPVEASTAVGAEPSASVDAEGRLDAPELLSKRGVPPFWFEREYPTHTTRAIAFPPLFVHREPKRGHPEAFFHADLSFTFGWYTETTARRHWLNPIALTYGYRSERKTIFGAVPLLMAYRRVGEQFNFGQFPLVWWWGTRLVRNVLVIPFHYQQRAPESFRAVSGIVAWYGHKDLHDADLTNDRRYLVVAPVFWRFQKGLRRFDISPLYVGGKNELRGVRHMSVLPLFHWQSREFGNRRELWTLPWIRRVDEARRRRAWAVPLALTFDHRDPDREVFAATPLFWRTRNHLVGSQLWLAGPLYRYTDPEQRNMALVPVWWRFHDTLTDRTTSVIAPLALSLRGPGELRVYTLLGGGGRTQDGWRMAVPPLLTFAGKSDRGVRWQGVAGLLWHVRQPDEAGVRGRDAWVLGPAGYLARDAEGTRLGLVPALSFFKWGGTKRYQVVTPLLVHVHDTDPAHPRRTVVLGAFYHHATGGPAGQQFDGGLAPLFFYGRGSQRNYGVIPWLLLGDVTDVAEQRRLTISPLFVRSKGPDHRTLGMGLIAWDVKRGADERHSVLFPVYYRRRLHGAELTLTPLGGRLARGETVTTVWGPYVRRREGERDVRGVLPLVYVGRRPVEGGTARHVVVAPLVLQRRTPSDDLDMWTPLVWRSEIRGERPRRGLAVVPFYFRQRQPGGVDVDAGLPFFWSRDERRRTHTLVAGPTFHRLSRTHLHTGTFPLYWWMDSKDKRRLLALPMTVHVEDKAHDSHTTISVPFWFDRKQVNGRRTWGAFPFMFGGRRIASFTRFSVAPPGFFDVFRLRRNARFTGYVPILFRYQKCGFRAEDDDRCRYTLWGSAPLFLYGRDGLGRVTHGSLVYYWDRRPGGSFRIYTPLFGVNNDPGKTLAWYAGPVSVRTTNIWRRTLAFPVFYRRAHRLEKRSLTLAVPPLYVARERKDRRFFEAGLVVWQFRQPHRVATAVVPPLFFHSHAYAERRLTWLMPLFVRDDHWAKDSAFTGIGPVLYFQRRRGEDLDFVQFPLLWHIERGDSQGTFGAFAWWDIRTRKGKTFQMVPGAYFRFANRKRDTKVVGPGLGWWTRGRGPNEGDLHWRVLFGLFGGGHEKGQRYLSFFGGRIPRGPVAGPSPAPAEQAARDDKRAKRAKRAERRAQRTERRAMAARLRGSTASRSPGR